MRSLVQIYALIVCFFSLMCLVIALGIGAYDIAELTAPELTLASEASAYYPYPSILTDGKTHSPEEITAAREDQKRWALDFHRRTAVQSFIFASIICLIDAVVFGIHWRIARKERGAPSGG